MTRNISDSEVKFVRESAVQGVRYDGRGHWDLRSLSIETGTLIGSNGSCTVCRPFTQSKVECAVKLEVIKSSEGGKIETSVDMSAVQPSAATEKQIEAMQVDLLTVLKQVFTEEALEIVQGERYWAVYVDMVVFGTDGNLRDLLYVAVYSALYDLQKPVITTYNREDSEPTDFDVDPYKTDLFTSNFSDSLCLCLSLFELAPQIFVTDVSQVEEQCALASLSAVIDKRKRVRLTSMTGAIPLDKTSSLLTTCIQIASELFVLLDAELEDAKNKRMSAQSA